MRYYILLIAFIMLGCKKSWLDIKSDKSLSTPTSVADLQALLDNTTKLNTLTQGLQQQAEIGTDNYYITSSSWQSLATSFPVEYRSYVFSKEIFNDLTNVKQWNLSYQRIYFANVAIDELDKLRSISDMTEWNNTYGQALFIRAFMFSLLQEVYGQPYKKSMAGSDLGISLRLSSDLNDKSRRATVEETFSQIIKDLQKAVDLLPSTTPYKTRPSKAAAHALLSRIYLITGQYDKVVFHAGEAIKLSNTLVDFNTLKSSTPFPMVRFNGEVLFHDVTASSIITPTRARVESNLYSSYHEYDLRKSILFTKQSNYQTFKGGYDGSNSFWGGIAIDEVYLNKAEGYIRQNFITEGLNELNTLLAKRWRSDKFISIALTDKDQALDTLLIERRKELLFRGIRWMDLRRLNQENRYQVTVKRLIDNTVYQLLPNSSLYAYPIPDDIILATGMKQNDRN